MMSSNRGSQIFFFLCGGGDSGPNLGPMSLNQAQNEVFLNLDHKFSLKLNTMIACENV